MKRVPLLPTQVDMEIFLVEFFNQYPAGKFYLTRLAREAKDFFSVPETAATIPCERAHGLISPVSTHFEQFVHWGCVHLLDKHIIKRTSPNEYQSVKGPSEEQERQAFIGEATAFFRQARKLGFPKAEAKEMVGTRWSETIIEEAARVAFA